MNGGAVHHDARRPVREAHHFSAASLSLDGSVVLNRMDTQRKTEAADASVGGKQQNGFKMNAHGGLKNGAKLYYVNGVKQNGFKGNHRNIIPNRRNITSEWQEQTKNSSHSNRSHSNRSHSNRSGSTHNSNISERSSAHRRIPQSSPHSTNGHSIQTKAPMNIRELSPLHKKSTVQPSGQKYEIVREQVKADHSALQANTEPPNTTVPTKSSNTQQNGPTPAVSQHEIVRDQVKADDLNPKPSRTPPNKFITQVESATDSHGAESIGPSTTNRKKETTSQPHSERTRRTGNRSMTKKTKSFSPPVRMSNLFVINQMHASNPEKDAADSNDESLDDFKGHHSGSSDGISLNRTSSTIESQKSSLGESQHSLVLLGTTPSIPEGEVIKPEHTLESSRASLFSDSSKATGPSPKRTLDSRIVAGRRNMLVSTRETHSFYEPTTTLKEKKLSLYMKPDFQATVVGGGKLPKPYKFKSKHKKEKEKRKQERREATRRAIRARRYAMPEDYQPLSLSFPILTESQNVFIHCPNLLLSTARTEVTVTTQDKKNLVATLSYTELKPSDKGHKLASGRRVLRDADGNQCALILHSRTLQGKNSFRICGPVPMSSHHKSIDGYFVWAEVKNIGQVHPQFCMTIKKDAHPQGQSTRFKTKTIGSTLLRCFGSKAHGFSIYCKVEGEKKTGGGKANSIITAASRLQSGPEDDIPKESTLLEAYFSSFFNVTVGMEESNSIQ
ncbi:MAG: hypothetical protein SGBAC_007728 [Bacillariaceae sp.]